MSEPYPSLYAVPSAEEFRRANERRGRQITFGALAAALIISGVFAAVRLDTPLLPIALLLLIVTPVILWHYPRAVLFITLAAACLFEIEPVAYSDDLTGRIPFFWNINTILQRYGHIYFKAVPLNMVEVFLVMAGAAALLRAIYTHTIDVRLGPLFWPIFIYICFVGAGWINGMLTGGDFIVSLDEIRAQFYFFIAYLIAASSIRERKHLHALLWTTVVCVGIKGILYTGRRYVTLHGMPLSDQGVGSHEEVFFFDTFMMLLCCLSLCRVQIRLQRVMWLLAPFVVLGEIACNRRAGTAALAIALPILLLAAYRALPDRRRLVGRLAIAMVIGSAIYFPLFMQGNGMLAEPARAVMSQFQPDKRDAESNAYRDAENADLMATVKIAPVQGYGYGKRMLHAVPIADISMYYEWWDVMTHNQILWVWMRVGTFGYFAFWMMIAAIIMHGCRLMTEPDADREAQAVALFSILTVSMLLIFGLLDLQLSNFRDMLFIGFWIGTLASLRTLSPGGSYPDRKLGQ